MSLSRIAAATAVLATATALNASAQTHRSHLGPRVGYDFDTEVATVGGQISFPIGNRLEFYPSADIHLVDEGSMFGVNLDLKYRIPGQSLPWLYVGAGLGIMSRSVGDFDDTDTGFNLMVGAESLRGRVHPFVEGRVIMADGSAAQLLAGLNFTL